jgi:hypothetical protein
MRGGKFQEYARTTGLDAVDEANALRKEQCELRLARIQNGKEPNHKNGPWASHTQEKGCK